MFQDTHPFYNWSNSNWPQQHPRIHLHFYNVKISTEVIFIQSEKWINSFSWKILVHLCSWICVLLVDVTMKQTWKSEFKKIANTCDVSAGKISLCNDNIHYKIYSWNYCKDSGTKNHAISCKSLKPCNLIARCVLINCILFFKLWKVKHLKTIVNKLINFQLHNLHFHQIKLPESLSFTSIAMITTGHISAFPWQLIITKISTTNEKGQTYPEKCLGFADNQLNRITIGFVVVPSDPLWT